MIIKTFDQFVAQDLVYNHWLKEDGLEIYVRKSLPYKGLIELANINAVKPGNGAFTRFLERIDHLPLKVENVVTDRFADFFRRRGWVELPCPYGVPDFLNKAAVDQGLGPINRALFYGN